MPTSRIIIGASVVAGALFVWWFAAGASFVSFVDRIATMRDGRPASPADFVFDEANDATPEPAAFTLDGRRRLVGPDWRIIEKPTGYISLQTSAATMVLGPITRRSSTNQGQRIYTFAPESGDSVSLLRRRSRLVWPRPFVISWLGGRLPFWSRNVYDRLVWRKSTGETLAVVWRDEQRLEPSSDSWMDQYQPTRPATSLIARKR